MEKAMSFGLNATGTLIPYVKINGKDGTVERSTYDGNERGTEIIENFSALFDFATVLVGYLRFEGERPDMRLAPLGDPMPDRPGEDYKQGIKMVVMLPGGLGPHEIATTASGVLGAFEKLHDAELAAPEWANGQIPYVKLRGFQREKTKFGPRAIPEFEIVGWKDRPEALLAFQARPKPRATMPPARKEPPA